MSEEIVQTDELARVRSDRDLLRSALHQVEAALTRERADAAQLRQTALAYVTSATYGDRARLRARLYQLATIERPGAPLLAELDAARKVISQVRWAVENHYAPPPLYDALATYDAAMKVGG